jgi:hypothetical protein
LVNDASSPAIRFTLQGNFTAIKAVWPNATEHSVNSNGIKAISVRVYPPTPENMRGVQESLLKMDVQVLTLPYVAYPERNDSGKGGSDVVVPPEVVKESDNTVLIAVCVAGVLLAATVAIFVIVSQQRQHNNYVRIVPVVGF